MTVKEYLKTRRNIPGKIIFHLLDKEFINDPLSEVDLQNLEFLEMVWGNREIIRAQLSKFSRKERESFVRTVVYTSKWERYVYNRFYNLPERSNLPIKKVLGEIEDLFCFHPTAETERRVKQIRSSARVAFCREKKTQR